MPGNEAWDEGRTRWSAFEAPLIPYIGWEPYGRNSKWVGSATFAPVNRVRVEMTCKDEFDRALKQGITAGELDRGRRSPLGFRALGRTQDGNLAGAWACCMDHGRAFARAAEVDAQQTALPHDQVNAALRASASTCPGS